MNLISTSPKRKKNLTKALKDGNTKKIKLKFRAFTVSYFRE